MMGAATCARQAAAQPSDSRVQVRAEVRDRIEGFTNAGFTNGRDDAYNLARVRMEVIVRPTRLVTLDVQAQDARPFGKAIGTTGAPFRDVVNLHQAFVGVGDPARSPIRLRVGRQELSFGEERLVGVANWLNAGRTFDGVRATLQRPRYQVDVFGASVVAVRDRAFRDSSGHGNRLLGVYGNTAVLVPNSVVQPYVLWRRDRNIRAEVGPPGRLSETTIGARWNGSMPARVEYGVEAAWQVGSVGSDTVRAWAGHWQLRRALPAWTHARLAGEYNYASGDRDPTDGRRGTFDQLYATGHDKFGLADQVGWRNISHIRTTVDAEPIKRLTIAGSYHSWWLADPHDGLYGAAGSMVARLAAGPSPRHVGQELDLQASHAVSPQLRIAGGYAHVFPGAFLVRATPGSALGFPYVAATYTFSTQTRKTVRTGGPGEP